MKKLLRGVGLTIMSVIALFMLVVFYGIVFDGEILEILVSQIENLDRMMRTVFGK